MSIAETVLVAIDDSPEARTALEHALERFPDAEITVVTVLEITVADLADDHELPDEVAGDHAETVLEDAVSIATQHGRDVRTETITGQPAKAIVSYADEQDVDHLVVGSRGSTGLKRVLLGSVAESVVRRAPCPVTVVR